MKKTLIIIFLTSQIFATDWYVNKNIASSGNGQSWATAWKNFSNINWASIQPGDRLFISGGTDSLMYYETLTPTRNGTSSNYITIIAGKYSPSPSGHSGRVIIDAQGTRDFSILIQDREYLLIKGFELRNGGQGGVYVEGNTWVRNIILDSLNIYDFHEQAGVFLNGYQNTKSVESVTIRNCRIITPLLYAGETDCLYMQGAQKTVIHNNYIRNLNQDPLAHNDALQAYHCDGFIIYNNVLINDSVYSPEGGGMPIILGSEGNNPVVIYNNFLYMGGAWYAQANMGAVICTRWYDTPPLPPTYIINNTIVVNGPRIRGLWYQYGVNLAANNIIAMYCPPAYRNLTWMANLDVGDYNTVSGQAANVNNIRNNLFWKMDQDISFAGNFSGNGHTGGVSGWTNWTSYYGGTGIKADPLFVSNIGYEPNQGTITGALKPNSPAINAGENLQSLIESYGLPWKDINGLTRGNTPSIGAYEYSASSLVDSLPDSFSFTNITNAEPDILYSSSTVTLAGFDSCHFRAGGYEYRINAGSWITGYTKVFPTNTVQLRRTSEAGYYPANNSTPFTAGSFSGNWTITNKAEPTNNQWKKILKTKNKKIFKSKNVGPINVHH